MSRTAIIIFMSSLCFAGCMDPLRNYQECVDIETARCSLRESCDSGFDYETCVAYAKEHCRTREIEGECPSSNLQVCVDACISAIEQVSCDILDNVYDETEDLEDCDFLEAVDEEPDGGGDTDDEMDAG